MRTYLWKGVLYDPPEEPAALSTAEAAEKGALFPSEQHCPAHCSCPWMSPALSLAFPAGGHRPYLTELYGQRVGSTHFAFFFSFFLYELFHTISLKTNTWHILHRHCSFSMFGGHQSPARSPEPRGDRVYVEGLQTRLEAVLEHRGEEALQCWK